MFLSYVKKVEKASFWIKICFGKGGGVGSAIKVIGIFANKT